MEKEYDRAQLECLSQLFLEMPYPAPSRKWLADLWEKGYRTINSLEKILREEYPPYFRVWQHQRDNERGALCPYLIFCLWRVVVFYPDPIYPGHVSRARLKAALQERDNGFSYDEFEKLQKLIAIEVHNVSRLQRIS